jgi:hypothetical protein
MSGVDELAVAQAAARRNGTADPESAAEQLTALLDLESGYPGLRVVGARVVGSGGRASADIYLSDGAVMTFESLREMATAKLLALEVAAVTGASPRLNQAQAIRAVALLRGLATHQLAATTDELSREWGLTFLQSAQVIDAGMDDQRQRWAAFSEIQRRDPVAAARAEGTSVAVASVVLRHHDGTRFVRAGWFRAHVRSEDMTVSPQEIAQRMQRVGWKRRGDEGLIKATRPDNPGSLAWRFYTVAAGWEEGAA